MDRIKTDTVVLGLGAMGSAALYHLALRGIPAIGIERFGLVHSRGSTHGPSRVFRIFYPHPLYVEMGLAALTQWRELESRTGSALLTLCGMVILALPDNPIFQQGLSALETMQETHTPLSYDELRGRFPMLHPPVDRAGCWIPRSGILSPESALKALITVAQREGAQVWDAQTVQSVDYSHGQFDIVLADSHIRCQRLICTAGAWSEELVPDLDLHLKITRQQKFQFQSGDISDLHPAHMPVYSDYEKQFYGFPAWQGVINVADDGHGDIVNPNEVDRSADPATREQLTQWVHQLFPQHTWQHVRTETCLYSNTPDDDFILDRHPAWPGMAIGAGFSGHGFKFTPLIGQLLVHLALEEEPPINIDALRLRPERLQAWTAV